MRGLLVSPYRTEIFATFVGAFSIHVSAATIHVDENASPGGNGLSWSGAFQFLQDALEVAGADDEIWVAEGTYYPDDGLDNPPADLREASFELTVAVRIYGGFEVGDDDLSDRDPETNITTLSGDIGRDDIGVGPEAGNSFHVITAQNVGSSTVLSGFTITRGFSEGAGIDKGAGILIDADPMMTSAPVITRCTVTYNRALRGGGIAVTGEAAPTLINCSITFNNAMTGAGMSLEEAAESTLLVNCLFALQLRSSGSAIDTIGARELQVFNCTFWYNDMFAGDGQIRVGIGSDVTITNSILYWPPNPFGPMIILEGGSVTVSYSDVLYGWIGEGNIDVDPKLVDPLNDDYRLGFGSPCIDVGSPNNLVEQDDYDVDDDMDFDEYTPDLDLNPRVEDGLADEALVVDMGTYEYRCLGDLNYDGEVGIGDFLDLITGWGPNPGHPGDLDRDGEVGINDFLDLLANWGNCPAHTGFPLTLSEELDDACITQEEYDDYLDVMTDPATKASEKIRYDCWMRHWIYYCPDCTCYPPHCPGLDPFS